MNRSFVFLAALSLLLCSNLAARAENLVAFPQGDAAWAVDITPLSGASSPSAGAGPKSPSARVVRVEVTQLKKLKRIHLIWSDGKTTEKWIVSGLPVTFNEDPHTGLVKPRQFGTQMEAIVDRDLTYDAFAFAWILPKFRQEKDPISFKGKQCVHYLDAAEQKEAWIDADTLLPVALNNYASQSVFKFDDKPPTGSLTPPPAFQNEILYYKVTMGYPLN